jgi:hypothetical protein
LSAMATARTGGPLELRTCTFLKMLANAGIFSALRNELNGPGALR